MREKDTYTVSQENGVLWVNGKHNCLGRIGPNGYEVYREMNEPVEVVGSTATLSVRVHPQELPKDWTNFVKLMEQHHKVDLSGVTYKPKVD